MAYQKKDNGYYTVIENEGGVIIPYYTISTGIDPDEDVGNAYSHYIIHDERNERYNRENG